MSRQNMIGLALASSARAQRVKKAGEKVGEAGKKGVEETKKAAKKAEKAID